MKEELVLVKQSKNKEIVISSIDKEKVSKKKWNEISEKIHKEETQFNTIKKYSKLLKDVEDLHFKSNETIMEINLNNEDFYSKISDLSLLIGKYCFAFLNFVTDFQRFVKNNYPKLETDLINYQYDNIDEYKLVYSLGNYYKHESNYIPLKSNDTKKGHRFFIDGEALLNSKFNFNNTIKSMLKSHSDFELIELLDVTRKCLLYQTKILAKKIFYDDHLSDFLETTYPFIVKYGWPAKCKPEKSKKEFSIFMKDDNIVSLAVDVIKILNSLDVTDIKIKYSN